MCQTIGQIDVNFDNPHGAYPSWVVFPMVHGCHFEHISAKSFPANSGLHMSVGDLATLVES